MVLQSLQPSSPIYFSEAFIFRKHFLFFVETSVNSTPRPDQTNVDSHIFVLMYVDDKIVKWTVINNVNMFFFLNKDFNEIASNERTSVIFIAV